MGVLLTPLAETDLEEIGDYIALDNPTRALTFIQDDSLAVPENRQVTSRVPGTSGAWRGHSFQPVWQLRDPLSPASVGHPRHPCPSWRDGFATAHGHRGHLNPSQWRSCRMRASASGGGNRGNFASNSPNPLAPWSLEGNDRRLAGNTQEAMNLRCPAQRQQVLAVLLRSDQGNQTPYSTQHPEWRLV